LCSHSRSWCRSRGAAAAEPRSGHNSYYFRSYFGPKPFGATHLQRKNEQCTPLRPRTVSQSRTTAAAAAAAWLHSAVVHSVGDLGVIWRLTASVAARVTGAVAVGVAARVTGWLCRPTNAFAPATRSERDSDRSSARECDAVVQAVCWGGACGGMRVGCKTNEQSGRGDAGAIIYTGRGMLGWTCVCVCVCARARACVCGHRRWSKEKWDWKTPSVNLGTSVCVTNASSGCTVADTQPVAGVCPSQSRDSDTVPCTRGLPRDVVAKVSVAAGTSPVAQ